MQVSYLPKSAKLLEFRQSNCVLSFQTKKWQNVGASVVIMSGKFHKQGDESTEMKFRGMRRNCIYVLKDKSLLPRKYIYLFFSP